jgi:hypothetical protein
MKKVKMLVLLICLVNYGIAAAQQDKENINNKSGWDKIGETSINFLAERYEIMVLEAARFSYIKFKVMKAPIILMNLEVFFESGYKQSMVVNSLIKEPGESWVVKINLGVRKVKKVVFVYKTLPNHKDEKALVELWGLKQISI